MTVSKWLIELLRECPFFPTWLFYNSEGKDSENLTIIENIGSNKVKEYLDGSTIRTHPFMLLIRTNRAEVDELEMQTMFAEVQGWVAKKNEQEYKVDEKTLIQDISSTSNLILIERDDKNNATYQAMFDVRYYKGV